jgi:signal transduction histidine kinase
VLLLDSQGRLTTVTPSALRTLGLPPSVIGQVLADSPASFLVPLLAEALLDDEVGTQEITLPNGQLLNVVVKPIDQGGWAFQLLRPAAPVPTQALALIPVPQPIPSPTAVPEGERIERFLTTFSNGIRTPLRALRDLIAQVPVAGALNDQQGRLIGQVVKLNSEIMMLINDLFALGQMRLQSPESRMPLRLDLLVEAAAGTLYAEFGRRGQQAVLEIPTDLPQITGSEEGLWRAVSAILDNAIKYSPTGATITVSVVQQAHEAVVSVKDTGAGLAPDELEQVFDPFYRAHSSQHLDIPGRGLGLAIAKAVVEQHGGRIWATSVIGEGSTFSFSLPC